MKKSWFFIASILLVLAFGTLFLNGYKTEFFLFRLSRVLMVFFSGAGLCLCAYLFQSLSRNPLSSEYTLGITAASSFLAGVGLLLKFSPVIFSVVGGVSATFLLFLFSSKKNKGDALILAGIALNIVFAAGLSFLNYLSSFKISLSLSRWIFGGFSYYSFNEVFVVAILALGLFITLLFSAPKLLLISISSEYEEILGKKFKLQYLLLLGFSGFFISFVTAFAGPVPFFALLMANLLRFLFKGEPLSTLFSCFFAGGSFLVFLDFTSRSILSSEELPIGILTGILGLPLLFFLLFSKKH